MIFEISKFFRCGIVGGAIRDEYLGYIPKDIDYLVEANEIEFESTFPNFEKVGNSFPVYLCPNTGREIALTRQEKVNGDKYQNFDCISGVTIETDLGRRDITINSIFKCISTGEIIDPYNGIEDIKNKIIRCVNPIAFSDDPLRILRICRTISRFTDFTIESNTLQMMKDNVHRLIHVPTERVYVELKKMYEQSETPSTFFNLLHEIGGLGIHFKPLEEMINFYAGPEYTPHKNDTTFVHTMKVIDRCKKEGYSFDCFLACLLHDVGKIVSSKTENYINGRHHYNHDFFADDILKDFLKFHRFTAYQNKLIQIVALNHMIFNLTKMKPVKLIRFFKRIKHVINDFICCCNCDHPLSKEQLEIFERLKLTFKTVKIEIPKEIERKGKESIVNFVENCYVNHYKDMT